MENVVVDRMRQLIAELHEARRGLMADRPRGATYLKIVEAQHGAEELVNRLERDAQTLTMAAD